MQQAGEVRFDFYYDGNKQTHANCLVINNADELIRKRIDFIRTINNCMILPIFGTVLIWCMTTKGTAYI